MATPSDRDPIWASGRGGPRQVLGHVFDEDVTWERRKQGLIFDTGLTPKKEHERVRLDVLRTKGEQHSQRSEKPPVGR